MLLAPLIELNASRVVVFRLAFLPGELDAVHAAVALVDHLHVVDDAAAEARAARSVRPDPVEVGRDELLLLRARRGGEAGADDAECRQRPCGPFHDSPPPKSLFQKGRTSIALPLRLSSAGTARAGASPWRSATGARGRSARQSGR